MRETFVQFGRTRDNLDPVEAVARERGMHTVLLEHSEQLRFRKLLGARSFDVELALDEAENTSDIQLLLKEHHIDPSVIFPGFESYVEDSYALSTAYGVGPGCWQKELLPFNKADQRRLLRQAAIDQPGFLLPQAVSEDALRQLEFPLVVKPADGTYGSDTSIVQNPVEAMRAIERIGGGLNFSGKPFIGALVEEFREGAPCSLQGLAIGGEAFLITACEQSMLRESGELFGVGFREVGHLATSGKVLSPRFRDFASACVKAIGYVNGPFHIDVIVDADHIWFLEMGFRLSGVAVVRLAQEVGGVSWPEASLDVILGDLHGSPARTLSTCSHMGQILLNSYDQLERSEMVAKGNEHVSVNVINQFKPQEVWGDRIPDAVVRDLERRPDLVGQLIVRGESRDQVIDVMKECAPARVAFSPANPLKSSV